MARRRGTNRGLVALNAALAVVAGGLLFSQRAGAQAGQARLRGEYIMTGGDVPFGSSNAVYVLDTANQEIVALRWNPTAGAEGELVGIGYRDLKIDADIRPGR